MYIKSMIYDSNPPYFWSASFLGSSEDRHLCRVGGRKRFFDHASIEKGNPPFQGVNGKTDQINFHVFLVGWLLPDVHQINGI